MSSGLGVSLHDVKYLCSFHLFLSGRLWSVWRVFVTVCMVMVSFVFESLRQVMCSLCRDSVSSFWCLWVSELLGVFVSEIKPLMFLAVSSLSGT